MDNIDAAIIQLSVDNDCCEKVDFSRCLPKPKKNFKTAEHLFAEIKNFLIKYKIKEFEFIDYCNISLLELDRLCTLIMKDKLEIKWSAPAILNPDMNYVILDRMRKAGCRKLIFDLFNGSDALLKKIGAIFTIEDASRLLGDCHNIGITTGINLVFGHPQETEEDFNNTINFLVKNLSFIDEITKLTYCLSNYLYSNFLPLSFCHYWTQCLNLNLNKNNLTKTFILGLDNCINKISKLGKPIAYIQPSKNIFDYLKRFNDYILRSKNLAFRFDKGKGHLFFKGLELTCGLGLYTSIFANGFWCDSEHADWEVNKRNEKELILKGRWHLLPIVQLWEIELKDETVIKLNIEMEVLEQTIIEGEQQTNIMLANEYNKWSADNNSAGFYPDLFNENWVTFFEEDTSKVKEIRAEINTLNSRLPPILLSYRSNRKGYHMSVLNTSSLFRARILKCYRTENKKYSPGKYFYFEGEIKIDDLNDLNVG